MLKTLVIIIICFGALAYSGCTRDLELGFNTLNEAGSNEPDSGNDAGYITDGGYENSGAKAKSPNTID